MKTIVMTLVIAILSACAGMGMGDRSGASGASGADGSSGSGRPSSTATENIYFGG